MVGPVTALALAVGGPVPVRAATPFWLEAGPAAGGLGLDADLADYRWDTRPASLWGGRVLAGQGPLALGLCGWRAATTQSTGLPGEATAPRVALTTLAAVGLARVASPLGCELWLGGQAGRLHADWEPGELVVDQGGEAVTVRFVDVDEWSLGVAAEIRRRLGRDLSLSLQAERSSWSLDTAHRVGDAIEYRRDRFANWTARLQVAWRWHL